MAISGCSTPNCVLSVESDCDVCYVGAMLCFCCSLFVPSVPARPTRFSPAAVMTT